MKAIHIPPAALEAGKRELYPHLFTESDDMAREIARAAFVAMVEAWEGMVDHPETAMSPRCLWLPIAQKQEDGDA